MKRMLSKILLMTNLSGYRSFIVALAVAGLTACGGKDGENNAINNKSPIAEACETPSSNVSPKDPSLKFASSEEAFEQSVKASYLAQLKSNRCQRGGSASTIGPFDGVAEGSAAGAPAMETGSATSMTNVQEQGVDEADIVKTDGQFLYVAKSNDYAYLPSFPAVELTVSAATTDSMTIAEPLPPEQIEASIIRIFQLGQDTAAAKEVGTIKLSTTIDRIAGLYLEEGAPGEASKQLLIIAEDANDQDAVATVFAYDVTDPAAPRRQWQFDIEGNYLQSRRIGNKLYFITQNAVVVQGLNLWSSSAEALRQSSEAIANISADQLLPSTTINGEPRNFVTAKDCLVPKEQDTQNFIHPSVLTVSAIDITDPNKTSALCTVDHSTEVYSSDQALYLTRGSWSPDATTVIHKLRYGPEGMEYAASGRVPGSSGWRNGTFRLSEYNGDLRIVTSDYAGAQPNHQLFVLRETENAPQTLKQIAVLPNEARPERLGKPGEDIYSARFFNDRAYIVTFRQIDPLYVINLNDPLAPYIEGALELPGFSNYLHPISPSLVLGVGKDVIEQNGVAQIQGVKIGLFDVANPAKPVQIGNVTIGKQGTETPVSREHHAFTITSDATTGKHRIGIPLQVHDKLAPMQQNEDPWAYYDWSYMGLHLFEVQEARDGAAASLIATGAIKVNDPKMSYHFNMRSVFQADFVHFILDDKVWSAPWKMPDQAVGPQ